MSLERYGILNQRQLGYLFNNLLMSATNKTSKSQINLTTWCCLMPWHYHDISHQIKRIHRIGVSIREKYMPLSRLMMPWLVASPGHSQARYRLQNKQAFIFRVCEFQQHMLHQRGEIISNTNQYLHNHLSCKGWPFTCCVAVKKKWISICVSHT